MNFKQPTILTNLQRGNVKQESPLILHQRTIHELAAQGEIYNIEPQMIDALDANNMTPLMWASGYGQISMVEFLLRYGANPNCKSNGGRTALMFAASRGFFHVIKSLISAGALVNDIDNSGNTAVMYAVHQDHPLVVQELIKSGCDLGFVNINGQTAYSIALINKSKSSQALLEAHIVNLLNGKQSCI